MVLFLLRFLNLSHLLLNLNQLIICVTFCPLPWLILNTIHINILLLNFFFWMLLIIMIFKFSWMSILLGADWTRILSINFIMSHVLLLMILMDKLLMPEEVELSLVVFVANVTDPLLFLCLYLLMFYFFVIVWYRLLTALKFKVFLLWLIGLSTTID